MSYGSETATGASVGNYMQGAGESVGAGSATANTVGNSAGFSLGGTDVGPTVSSTQPAGTISEIPNSLETANTAAQPGWFDNAMDYLERFQKGRKQNMPEAWRGRGNNPETYGYLTGKVDDIMGMGGSGGGVAPITTNINYQEPENPYLRRYARRY